MRFVKDIPLILASHATFSAYESSVDLFKPNAMHKNKLLTLLILSGLVILGVAAVKAPAPPNDFKNLQILPKNISQKQLDSIMESYNKALGVTCKFCHEELKTFPGGLDYASDKEPMKNEARKMMRLTIDINKNYFYYDSTKRPEFLTVVTCNTCHRGEAFPEH